MCIVALLSAVEASSLSWIPCGVWSCLRALDALVTSCKSLEHIGLSDHLVLWSCIALPHWLGPLLKLLLSRIENRPDRRRSNAASRIVALLVLALLFALAFYHFFVVFQDKSLVYHSLKISKVTSFQGISKSIIQTIEKTILLLFIGVHVVRSVAGELCEASDVLTHIHRSLL
jgi:hypothetical protein